MPDENTPEQQTDTASTADITVTGQQDNVKQIDWEGRYRGLSGKYNELSETLKALQADLTAKTSQVEQLHGQVAVADTEKTAVREARDKQIQELVTTKTELEGKVSELEAMQLKIEVAKELGRTDLISILQHIPNMTDKEALTTVMKDFAGWSDTAVKQREDQLLSGITAPAGETTTRPPTPQTQSQWEKMLEVAVDPREREAILMQMGDWLEDQHRPS
jgi:chromosome segregation ATPase